MVHKGDNRLAGAETRSQGEEAVLGRVALNATWPLLMALHCLFLWLLAIIENAGRLDVRGRRAYQACEKVKGAFAWVCYYTTMISYKPP